MKNRSTASAAPTLLAAVAMTACATRPSDFGGRWQDANPYAEATQAIPLHRPYVFAPTPMDGTLRTMLQRWTSDAGMRLQYDLAADYTLFAGVARIRSADLREAASMLEQAYAAQHIAMLVEGDRLLVRPLAAPDQSHQP